MNPVDRVAVHPQDSNEDPPHMQARNKTLLKYAGCAGLTLLLTLYFMFLTFPYSALVDRFLPNLKAGLPGQLSLGQIRATPLLWIEASKVELSETGVGSTPLLNLSRVRVRPALLSLIIGRPALTVRADAYAGSVKGRIGRRQGALDLSLSWKNLQADRYPALTALGGGTLNGRLSGQVELRVNPGSWDSSEGTLSVDLADGSSKGVQVSGFSLPDLAGLTGKAQVKVGQRKADLADCSLQSEQVSASLQGKIDLAPRLNASRLSLTGKLKLDGQLAGQYEPMLAGFLRNKDAAGFYTFSLRGTLASPRFSL